MSLLGDARGESVRAAKKVADAARAERIQQRGIPEVFRGFGFPGAEDLGNMFQFKGARDLKVARSLHPGLQTFDQWLTRHAARIPVESEVAAPE